MSNALKAVAAGLFVILLAGQAWCAGPMGHFLIGSIYIDQIRNGNAGGPDQLREILQYPECRNAFAGGAIGPDICEEASHYGNTADLARKMLADALTRLRQAEDVRDASKLAKAQRDMAFACGWLSHCATDLSVHVKVNAFAGDTYRFCDTGQKVSHAAQEAQLTAYLRSVLGTNAPKYDTYIPYEFLSKHTGVKVEDLQSAAVVLKTKAIAEIAAADQVTVNDAIRNAWKSVTDASVSDTAAFIRDPDSMDNWDLDCGRITTMEFDELRANAIKANSGTLPKNWGKNYMDWYQQTKGMDQARQITELKTLIGGEAQVTFQGKWKTNWGLMTLTVAGDHVTGSYPHDKGKIDGTVSADGYTLTGKWTEAPSYSFPNDGGNLILTLSKDGKSLSGKWWYGSDTSKSPGNWTGTKQE